MSREQPGKRDPQPELRLPAPVPQFVEPLLRWYRKHRRSLPWRELTDPYQIWISEVMLQQTRVEAALPYFQRFLRRFPTIRHLAAATEEEVLSLWSGLGYYNRARNLFRAARKIVNEFDGRFPSTFQDALNLPGVGRYTAGAVLSIAYGLRIPVVDGNVTRVLARYLKCEETVTGRMKGEFWSLLEGITRNLAVKTRIRDFNQALMELGALVCIPGRPRCPECPLGSNCGAYRSGLEQELPRTSGRRRTVRYDFLSAVVRKDDRYLLAQNVRGPFLRQFWEFPRVEKHPSLEGSLEQFELQLGLHVEVARVLPPVIHQITFRRLHFHPCLSRLKGTAPDHFQWVRLGTPGYPISSYLQKIDRLVRQSSLDSETDWQREVK